MNPFLPIKLTDFSEAGTADAVRLAFNIGGVSFEDRHVSRDKSEVSWSTNQLPMLEAGNEVLTQPSAMLRFAGRLGGLYPVNDPFAALKIDEVLHALCELEEKITPICCEPHTDKMIMDFATTTLPRYAGSLESRLKAIQKLPAFQTESVFVHEIAIYSWVKSLREGFIEYTSLDGYEHLKAAFDKISNNPKPKTENSVSSETPKLKLTYFPLPDRAEAIRLAFFIGNIEFEDVTVSAEQVATIRPTLPFNQVPILEMNGEAISQSFAILRYAGVLSNLYPTTDVLVAARIDEVFAVMDKMYNSPDWRKLIAEQDETTLLQLRENLARSVIPRTLEVLEKRVAQFQGPYAAGADLTVADLAIYALVLVLKAGRPGFPITVTDPFHRLQRVFELVKQHAKVVEWNVTHGIIV